MDDFLLAPWQAKLALATLFLSLIISSVTDLRRRLILNAVTYPALLIVLGCFLWLGGLELVGHATLGILVCAGPMLLGLLLGAIGAGDVKLMAVSGAVSGAAAGWAFSLTVLIHVSLAGGLQAVAWILAARLRGQDRPRYVPYGLAIALGTFSAFLWGTPFLSP